MHRKYLLLPFVALGIIAASCSQQLPYSLKTLPSGHAIKITGVSRMAFSGGDQALMLKYYSDIDFTKRAELKAEVEEIWQQFRNDVEQANLNSAIISANQMPHGMFSSTQGWNFVYEKKPDGNWILKE